MASYWKHRSNRTLDGIKLSQWNQRLKHQPYTRIELTAINQRKRPYLIRTRQGRLKTVPSDVCVLIRKRNRGYYVKQFLGLGDFRAQLYEAMEK